MSLSIGWRDVGSSWGDTGKVMGAALASTVIAAATDIFIRKAFDCFNMPHLLDGNLLAREGDGNEVIRAQAERNDIICEVVASAVMLIGTALMPVQFESFSLKKNIQLSILDVLLYAAARKAFQGNAYVESRGFQILALNRTPIQAGVSAYGSHSKFIIPVFFALDSLASRCALRAGGMEQPVEGSLSQRYMTRRNGLQRWMLMPVTDVAAPVDDPLLEA